MADDAIYDHDDAKYYFLQKYTLFSPSLTSSTSYEPHTMRNDKGIKDYGIIGGDTLKTFNLKAVTGTTVFPPEFLWNRKEWRGILRDFSLSGCFLLLCTARLHVSHACFRIIFSTKLSGTTGGKYRKSGCLACPNPNAREFIGVRSIKGNEGRTRVMFLRWVSHKLCIIFSPPMWDFAKTVIDLCCSQYSMHMLQFR